MNGYAVFVIALETRIAAPHVFSLLSMILAVAGVLMAALLLIFIPVRNRYFDSELAFYKEYGFLTDETEAEINKHRSRGFVPRLLAVLAGIASFIVWLLVDLPLDNAVWINRWTPLVAALFIVCLALTVLYNARKQRPGEGVYSKTER